MMFAVPFLQTLETSAFTFAGTLIVGIVWALVNVNIRHWAVSKGHDVYILRLWDLLPEWGRKLLAGWSPLRQLWWLWLSLGVSGGLGIALWLLAPEAMPIPTSAVDIVKAIDPIRAELDNAKQQIASLQSQLDAKNRLALVPISPPIDVLSGQQKNLFIQLGKVFGEMRVHQSELLASANELLKSQPSGPGARGVYVPPCRIIVSSTKENQNFAVFIETIAQSQQCQAQDALAPPPKPRPIDADEPPPKPIIPPGPLDYVVVRYPHPEDIQNLQESLQDQLSSRFALPSIQSQELNDKTAKFRDQIADRLLAALQGCGLDARRSRKAEGSPGWPIDKWTIYIDLGSVQICR
jgi:hypothetical protein